MTTDKPGKSDYTSYLIIVAMVLLVAAVLNMTLWQEDNTLEEFYADMAAKGKTSLEKHPQNQTDTTGIDTTFSKRFSPSNGVNLYEIFEIYETQLRNAK